MYYLRSSFLYHRSNTLCSYVPLNVFIHRRYHCEIKQFPLLSQLFWKLYKHVLEYLQVWFGKYHLNFFEEEVKQVCWNLGNYIKEALKKLDLDKIRTCASQIVMRGTNWVTKPHEGSSFPYLLCNCGDLFFQLLLMSGLWKCSVLSSFKTECYEDPSCNSGYMCDDGHCIPGGRRDTTVSLVFGVLIVVIVVFLCCCCIMLKDEAQGNRKITPRVVTTDAETSRMRHIQQNEQMGSNEVSSVNELPQHEEARNQISDTIAYSCLQSCIDDRYNTEAPPPSYEEVMGAS